MKIFKREGRGDHRLRHLPSIEDICKDFYRFDIRRAGEGERESILATTCAAYEAYLIVSAVGKAEEDLRKQRFVQESDLQALRGAAWAAYDTARDLEQIDRQLISQSAELERLLVLCIGFTSLVEPRSIFDDKMRPALRWIDSEISDPQLQVAFDQSLLRRKALLQELRPAVDAIAVMARQARWLASTMENAGEAAAVVDQAILAERRLTIEHAGKVSDMLVAGVSEALGIEEPRPQLASGAQPLKTADQSFPDGPTL